MVEFEPALKALTKENVDFVVVGGLAISAHSSGWTHQGFTCFAGTRSLAGTSRRNRRRRKLNDRG